MERPEGLHYRSHLLRGRRSGRRWNDGELSTGHGSAGEDAHALYPDARHRVGRETLVLCRSQQPSHRHVVQVVSMGVAAQRAVWDAGALHVAAGFDAEGIWPAERPAFLGYNAVDRAHLEDDVVEQGAACDSLGTESRT